MDIDKRRLHDLADEVDQLQHEGRRRFLRQVGIGTAVAVGASTAGVGLGVPGAWAQDEGPSAFPNEDERMLQFAQTLERAFVEAYVLALPQIADPDLNQVVDTFREHHIEHVAALGDALRQSEGDIEDVQPNEMLLTELEFQLTAAPDQDATLAVLRGIEESAAATYLETIGQLTEAFNAQAVAEIQPVESQHAAVYGSVLGLPPAQILPARASTDAALDLAEYGLR